MLTSFSTIWVISTWRISMTMGSCFKTNCQESSNKQQNKEFFTLFLQRHKSVGRKAIFWKTIFHCHLLVCIVIDIFDFLQCFTNILHKYKFHDKRGVKLNLDNYISVGWNIFQEPLKRKLIITDQTSPLEKNLHSRTAEASDIKDTILFNDNPFRWNKISLDWLFSCYFHPRD